MQIYIHKNPKKNIFNIQVVFFNEHDDWLNEYFFYFIFFNKFLQKKCLYPKNGQLVETFRLFVD